MQNIARRSFFKSIAATTAVVSIASALKSPAFAADEMADVKFAKDPKNLQPGVETSHTASISLGKAETKTVAYGKTPVGDFYWVTVQAKHESTKEHHIFSIALYLNGEPVAEHTMNQSYAEASLPVVTFVQRVKKGDDLLVVTTCYVHGKWGSRLKV